MTAKPSILSVLILSAAWSVLAPQIAEAATRYDGDGIVIPWCEAQRWYINRARFNPEAEADRLSVSNSSAGGHPNYDVCEGGSFGTTTNQWAPWTASMQPLAPNEYITRAASNHCVDMFTLNYFGHPSPSNSAFYVEGWNWRERQAQEGYTNNLASGSVENIQNRGYWSSGGYPSDSGFSPEQFHAAWFTDYGESVRGHRRAILNAEAREIGIGYLLGHTLDGSSRYWTFEYCTEDFARHGNDRFFTDTVFYDKNTNSVYNRGEGVGNVEIRLYDGAPEAAWYDVSGASGSFAIPTTNLTIGNRIDVMLVNKTGASTNITIPRSFSATTKIFLTNNQAFRIGSYMQSANNAGFRNVQWMTNLTIAASAGAGGSISPSGTVSLALGQSQQFTITRATNSGYYIASVLVDGVSWGAITSYTFSSVTSNHTIAAYFALTTNIITSSAGTGGSISPYGSVKVAYGASQAFTISSNAGYRVANVSVDGVSTGVVSSYTFTNVTSNRSISVSFAVTTNIITATAGPGGSISPQGAVNVPYGASQTFNISTNLGFNITNVLVDGVSVGIVTSYRFTNVTRSRTIAALFGAAPDSDGDGMTDSWETRYFAKTNAVNGDPDDDWDGDGMSNLKEYIAGTDPTNENSELDVSITRSADTILIGVDTVIAGPTDYGTAVRHYGIEQVPDLFDTWSNVVGYADFIASGGEWIFTNSSPASQCFYRVKAWLGQ